MKSCLIILNNCKNSQIFKTLESSKYINKFPSKIENELKAITLNNFDNIRIISSDRSGVGKSMHIKYNILKMKKKYIYFPIGGVLTRKSIYNRLKNLELTENSAIHLDLNDTENIDLMEEFLFGILITKIYKVNEDIFFFSENMYIQIEIPNGFISFKNKFPILDLIPQNKNDILSIYNISPLIIPKELDSNIQIVCNYLKLLEDNTINLSDLIIPNITPKDLSKNRYSVPSIPISEKEAQRLIFQIITKRNKNLSYYQITSLINILAVQFKKFNQCYFLNPYYLNCTFYIRSFIIENFINLSAYLIDNGGVLTKLINEQNNAYNKICLQNNENKEIKKGINNLIDNLNEEHSYISLDKINHILLFFNEGLGQGFNIITNKDPEDKEYLKFLYLKNCQSRNKEEEVQKLPNYKEYKQFDFLKELKEILNLNPSFPVKKEEKKNEDGLSLEEIVNNYVFTPDNFVKMLIILLKMRANIPVILMGETGCGKTLLIKKLFELLNYGSNKLLKILNIHAGTDDDEIIEFIKKINKEAEILYKDQDYDIKNAQNLGLFFEEKKIWVFLDEINTCKSIGLITELMIKHSYHGKKIKDNIVFIAACNPYRQKKQKNQGNIEIDILQPHKQNKIIDDKKKRNIEKTKFLNNTLVYTVNPLPHSLLHFTIDFGNLKPKDEEKYIDAMVEISVNKIFQENKDYLEEKQLSIIKSQAKEMVIKAQNLIRINNDISSVSLRDMRRFIIFYEFYYNIY